jgi:hypothetical protein
MLLTKSAIAKLPLPSAGQAFYRDDKLKGLAVRVTAGASPCAPDNARSPWRDIG